MKTLLMKSAGVTTFFALLIAPNVGLAQLGVDANVRAVTETDAYLESLVTVEGNSTTSVDGADGDVSADLDSNVDVNVNRENNEEGRSVYQLNDLGVAVLSSSEVKTESDLVIFGRNIAAKEEIVSDVKFDISDSDQSEIVVYYNYDAKLFGLIPMTMTSKILVKSKADGTVEVEAKKPWYRFMVAGDSALEAEIEQRIKQNAEVTSYSHVDASASTHAQVAEMIIADLKAQFATTASLNN